MKSRFPIRHLTIAAMTGALYVALSYYGHIFGLTYGPIQCRFSEALTVLPFLAPFTTGGLFIGCLVANILSPYGVMDLVFGSLATLLAGVWTAKCPNKWLAPLPPVICNGLIVGAMITYQEVGFGAAFSGTFLYNAATVGLAELIACYGLGLPLLAILDRSRAFSGLRPAGK